MKVGREVHRTVRWVAVEVDAFEVDPTSPATYRSHGSPQPKPAPTARPSKNRRVLPPRNRPLLEAIPRPPALPHPPQRPRRIDIAVSVPGATPFPKRGEVRGHTVPTTFLKCRRTAPNAAVVGAHALAGSAAPPQRGVRRGGVTSSKACYFGSTRPSNATCYLCSSHSIIMLQPGVTPWPLIAPCAETSMATPPCNSQPSSPFGEKI